MIRSLPKCTALTLGAALVLAACEDGGGGWPPPAIEPGIRVNQVGYAPLAQKLAVVVGGTATTFQVVDAGTGAPVGAARPLGEASTFALSGEEVRVADFTDLTAPGAYRIQVEGLDPSPGFDVAADVYRAPSLATLKAFYYWRASTEIDEEHGGAWHRAAGHPNVGLPFHPTAAAAKATPVTTWSAPKGWYDAGDYGEYVVNAGVTVGTLLAYHELFPTMIGDGDTGIPEADNEVSDLLDEVRWELEWLLAMQDEDGGVFFKIAGTTWPGWVMPAADPTERVVIGKSTTSALDFAAVLAMAARLYGHDAPFAARCLAAARGAYTWALAHPAVAAPPSMQGSGPYDDVQYADEFTWAAAELYLTTGEAAYRADAHLTAALATPSLDGSASWQGVKNLAYYSLALNANERLDGATAAAIQEAICTAADEHLAAMAGNAYRFPLDHFSWGSAGQVANVGVLLLYATYWAPDADARAAYRNAAIQTADYLLGKNSTGHSFVTGVGDLTPMHIHHRPSEADLVADPVPGLLTGGPNSGREDRADGARYPALCSTDRPAFCWTDSVASYASNEPAINQNAAAFFLFAGVDAFLGFL